MRITLFFLTLLFALPALAADTVPASVPGVEYSPEYCEFTARFPEEPYRLSYCPNPKSPEKCYEQASYTQVFELSSTVRLKVACTPSSEDLYTQYSPEVMQATLRGMTRRKYVKEIDHSQREGDGYKEAGLVAQGAEGRSDKIYIAQLWIGRHSVMTVEAEMIGETVDSADALLSSLLNGVRYTGVKASSEDTAPEAAKTDAKKD
jgi:DNA polymerase II small subunit/DNA polymerase delta subunit B